MARFNFLSVKWLVHISIYFRFHKGLIQLKLEKLTFFLTGKIVIIIYVGTLKIISFYKFEFALSFFVELDSVSFFDIFSYLYDPWDN